MRRSIGSSPRLRASGARVGFTFAALAALAVLAALSRLAIADTAPKSMQGCKYPAASAFVERYCSECHTATGGHALKKRAYAVLQLDTYDQWKSGTKVITAVLDKWHLDGRIMPPPKASAQPTDAERKAILDWLARGSPNTATGR